MDYKAAPTGKTHIFCIKTGKHHQPTHADGIILCARARSAWGLVFQLVLRLTAACNTDLPCIGAYI